MSPFPPTDSTPGWSNVLCCVECSPKGSFAAVDLGTASLLFPPPLPLLRLGPVSLGKTRINTLFCVADLRQCLSDSANTEGNGSGFANGGQVV